MAPRVDVQQQHEAKRARVGNVALPTFMEMRDYIAEQLAPRIKSIKEIYLTLIRAHGRM